MLDEVSFLPECFAAVLTSEWFLPGVCSQMNLNIGLVKESSAANMAVVHHLLAILPDTSIVGPIARC